VSVSQNFRILLLNLLTLRQHTTFQQQHNIQTTLDFFACWTQNRLTTGCHGDYNELSAP